MSELAIIAALTKTGVMGANNALPWSLPGDLKRFKQLTTGHPIIMGRMTYDSIGRPLPGRLNIVISRNKNLVLPPGVLVVESLKLAIDAAGLAPKKFIIGGAQIIREALPLANSLYLTWIEKEFKGDVFFPEMKTFLAPFKLLQEVGVSDPFPHVFADYQRCS